MLGKLALSERDRAGVGAMPALLWHLALEQATTSAPAEILTGTAWRATACWSVSIATWSSTTRRRAGQAKPPAPPSLQTRCTARKVGQTVSPAGLTWSRFAKMG